MMFLFTILCSIRLASGDVFYPADTGERGWLLLNDVVSILKEYLATVFGWRVTCGLKIL